MAGRAVELGHVTRWALAVRREDFGQRLHECQVQVPRHADAVPSRHALRWAVFPILERLRVVAIGAVHAQRCRHVRHQPISPLGLLDRLAVARRQRRWAVHADVLLVQQKRGEGVVGQRGQIDHCRRLVLSCLVAHEVRAIRLRVGLEPDGAGHGLAPVAGVAGHPGLGNVWLPVGVDVLSHLDHAARHHLGVFAVVFEVGQGVAIGATFARRNPAGHGDHQAVEIAHAQVTQHFDVLVDLRGLGAIRARRWNGHRRLVLVGFDLEQAGVVDLRHAGAPVAALHRFRNRAFATCQHEADQGQTQAFGHAAHPTGMVCGVRVHGLPPVLSAGSTIAGKISGYGGATPCLMAHRYQLSTTVPVSKMPMPPVMGHRTANHQAQR